MQLHPGQALSIGTSIAPGNTFCYEEYFEAQEPFVLKVYHHNVDIKSYVFDFRMTTSSRQPLNEVRGKDEHELHMYVPVGGTYEYCIHNPLKVPQIVYVDLEHGVEVAYQGALPGLPDIERASHELMALSRIGSHVSHAIDSKHLYFEVSKSLLKEVSLKIYGVSAVIILLVALLGYCQVSEVRRILHDRKVI